MTESVSPLTPSTDTTPVDRLALALKLASWMLVIQLGSSLLMRLIGRFMTSLPLESWERWNNVTWVFNGLVDVCAVGVLAFTSLRLASASTGAHRRLATTAAALFGARGLMSVVYTVLLVTKVDVDPSLNPLRTVLAYGLYYGSWGLIFWVLGRGARAWGFRFPLVPVGVAVLGSIAGDAIGRYWWQTLEDMPQEKRDVYLYVMEALSYATTLALAAVFFLSRSRLVQASAPAAPDIQRVSSPEWRAASDGLALYRGSLLARIAVTLLGIPLLIHASSSGEQEEALGLLQLLTLVTLVCGLAGLGGIFGYSKIPEWSGARGPARTALWIGLTGSLFDIWALTLVFRLSRTNVSAAFDFMDKAPWVEAGAQTAGLVALLFLLISFHEAARALEATELASRATTVGWVIGIAGFAGTALKLVVSTTRGASEWVILALPVVGALLFGVVSFVSLVGALARTMHAGPPREPEPSILTP